MGFTSVLHAGHKAWRRPTLPQLKLKYHRRSLVSRPSSRWDRVGHRRYGHQAMKPAQKAEVLEIVQTFICIQRHLAEVKPSPTIHRTDDDGEILKREKSN